MVQRDRGLSLVRLLPVTVVMVGLVLVGKKIEGMLTLEASLLVMRVFETTNRLGTDLTIAVAWTTSLEVWTCVVIPCQLPLT
jgi:hypothetical protein